MAAEATSTFYVQALYSYAGIDTVASLSFKEGDTIEVFTQLDSGWWDGILCETQERGWFPSNYVAKLPEGKAIPTRVREDEDGPMSGQSDDGGVNGQNGQSMENEGQRSRAETLEDSQIAQQQVNRLMGFGGTENLSDEEGLGSFSSGGNVFGELAAAAAVRSSNYHSRQDHKQYHQQQFQSGSTGGANRGYDGTLSYNATSHPRGNSREGEITRRYGEPYGRQGVQPNSSINSRSMGGSRPNFRTSSHPHTSIQNKSRQYIEDFWIPKTTSDGQIIYENQQTGEISRDLPFESDYMSSSNAYNSYTSDSNTDSSRISSNQHSPVASSFPIGVPEQWVSKWTDDGSSIFYENMTTGEVRWAPPEGAVIVGVVQTRSPAQPQQTLRNNSSTSLSNKKFEVMGNRSRSHSLAQSNESIGSSSARRSSNFLYTNASSLPSTSRSSPTAYDGTDLKRLSHHSNGSYGSDRDFNVMQRRASSRRSRSTLEAPRQVRANNAADVLEPPPPLTLGELEIMVTNSINDLFGPSRMKELAVDAKNPYFEEEETATSERNNLAMAMDTVVANVRSLLHAAGVGEGAIGATYVPMSANDEPVARSSLTANGLVARTPLLSQSALNELRESTVTVISTLSKLVLSVRAVWGLLETIPRDHKTSDGEEENELVVEHRKKVLIERRQNENKLRSDIFRGIKELADAVVLFVQEYERVANDTLGGKIVLYKGRLQAPKRIHGVLVTNAAALILPGGGYGGNWRGNGFVTLPARSPVTSKSTNMPDPGLVYEYPSKPLGAKVEEEVDAKLKEVEKVIIDLKEMLDGWVSSKSKGSSEDGTPRLSDPSPTDLLETPSLNPNLYSSITNTAGTLLFTLGKFLHAVEDIDIANKVDLEMDTELLTRLNKTISVPDEGEDIVTDSQVSEYKVVTQQAKPVLSEFEKYKQALYNSAPSLMFAIQGLSLAVSMGQSFYEPDEVDSLAQPVGTAPLSTVAAPKQRITSPQAVLVEVNNMEVTLSALMKTLHRLREIADAQDTAPRRLRRESIAFREGLADMHLPKISKNGGAVGLDVESGYDKDSDQSSMESTFFIGNPTISGPPPVNRPVRSATTVGNASTQQHPRRTSLNPDQLGHRSDSSLSAAAGSVLFEAKSPQRKKRLEQLLGPDYTPGAMVNPTPLSQEEAVPWFLGKDYTDDEISFSVEGNVKGGSLQALVTFLTSHEGRPDSQFLSAFLMTYQTFCTSLELLDLLSTRYCVEPPPDLTQAEIEIWTEKKQRLVRPRVINVIKTWIENYLPDDVEPTVIQALINFANGKITDVAPRQQIIRSLERRDTKRERGGSVPLGAPPPAIVPKSRKLKFLDIDALEMARQLTVMDSTLFRRITPRDCLTKAWPKKYGTDPVNFKAITDMSVAITRWVEKTILLQDDIRKRTNTIKHFINIADRCRSLNNYATFFYIVAGLQSTSVHRLKRTWDTINTKNMSTYDSMTKLVNPEKNFGAYRDCLRRVTPPCVPFLGVYLSDWTFIGDGSADTLRDKPNHINFNKRQKAAELILAIQLHQQISYNLIVVDPIVKFINDAIANPENEQALYEMSISLEPREREDEKIARLLQESGFL